MNSDNNDTPQPRQSKSYTLRYDDAAGAYGAASASGSIRYPCSRDEAIDAIGAHAVKALGGPVRLDVRGNGVSTPVSVVWGVVATLDPGTDEAIDLADAVQEFNAATFAADMADVLASGPTPESDPKPAPWLQGLVEQPPRLDIDTPALPNITALAEQLHTRISETFLCRHPANDVLEPGLVEQVARGPLPVVELPELPPFSVPLRRANGEPGAVVVGPAVGPSTCPSRPEGLLMALPEDSQITMTPADRRQWEAMKVYAGHYEDPPRNGAPTPESVELYKHIEAARRERPNMTADEVADVLRRKGVKW